MDPQEKLRVDKYLWAIRIFKTRSLSTEACGNGKVKNKGINIKPSKPVTIGDQFEIKTEARKWTIEVVKLLHNRVQYAEAIKHYIDLTPKDEPGIIQPAVFIFQTGKRQSKQGRPTKKQKRNLDEFME